MAAARDVRSTRRGCLRDQTEVAGVGDGLGWLLAPSLSRMWLTCFFTVSRARTSSSAICWLALPAARAPAPRARGR